MVIIMNKFQAMAQIMAILCEYGLLKAGTQEYKIARKKISSKIDHLGPEAAWEQAKRLKGKFLEQDSIEDTLEELKKKLERKTP